MSALNINFQKPKMVERVLFLSIEGRLTAEIQ